MIRPAQTRTVGLWLLGVAAVGTIAMAAWWRVGLLALPGVPGTIGLGESGLADLAAWKAVDQFVRGGGAPTESVGTAQEKFSEAATRVRDGVAAIAQGDSSGGLAFMREGVAAEPGSLVLGNVLRMTLFQLRREFLLQAKRDGKLTPRFPDFLDRQPIRFFEQMSRSRPSREVDLQLALSWVDEMLLFPALEIKAPASVESVAILNRVLDREPGYVPALVARGLNHLHRPARLVWPETRGVPPDAAAQDIGLAIAIGRKLGVGTDRLRASLALALGDAYVKAGQYSLARSWWQIAQNATDDPATQAAVRRRYGWRDEEMIDRLEAELDRARNEPARPLTDLAMMWD